MSNPQNYPELPSWSRAVINLGKYSNMGCMHVNSIGYMCVLRRWEIIEHETKKKNWNRLSSLGKGYSLYHILDHSLCSMKDALAGGETEGRQQFQLPIC